MVVMNGVFVVYGVLEELRNKQYQSQMDRYLQLFHHRPVAAALFKKVCFKKRVHWDRQNNHLSPYSCVKK